MKDFLEETMDCIRLLKSINFNKNYLPSEISSKINLRVSKVLTLVYLTFMKTKARSSKIHSWLDRWVAGKPNQSKLNTISRNTKGMKTPKCEKSDGALTPKQGMPAMICKTREPGRHG